MKFDQLTTFVLLVCFFYALRRILGPRPITEVPNNSCWIAQALPDSPMRFRFIPMSVSGKEVKVFWNYYIDTSVGYMTDHGVRLIVEKEGVSKKTKAKYRVLYNNS